MIFITTYAAAATAITTSTITILAPFARENQWENQIESNEEKGI